MNAQMMVGQMLEHSVMVDFSFRIMDLCWDECYDKQLKRDELKKGEIDEAREKVMAKCHSRCINRSFEVMKLMMQSREQREKEAMLGLPPGGLSEQK